MDNIFELPVTFNGEELSFKAKLMPVGYVNKFEVEIEGKKVIFEQDEEGQYRALQDYGNLQEPHPVNTELLKEIALVIQIITE